MNLKSIFLNFIFYTWCLPQTFLGIIYYFKFRTKIISKTDFNSTLLIKLDIIGLGGFSLGKFIFLDKKTYSENEIKHEYGHTIQNFILGPFYLLVIGIPSQLRYLYAIRYYHKDKEKYYKLRKEYFNKFPENWADKLGKVSRD